MKVFVCGPTRSSTGSETAGTDENFGWLGVADTELAQQVASCPDGVAYVVAATRLENVARRQIALAHAAHPKIKVGLMVHASPTVGALLANIMAVQQSPLGALKAWHFLGERMDVWVWAPRIGRLSAPQAALGVVAQSWLTSRGCLAQPVAGGVVFPVPAEGGVLPWEPWPSDAWVAAPEDLPEAPARLVRDRSQGTLQVIPASWCTDAAARYGDGRVRELVVVQANTSVPTWEWTPTWQCHGCAEERVGEVCVFCNAVPKPEKGVLGVGQPIQQRRRRERAPATVP